MCCVSYPAPVSLASEPVLQSPFPLPRSANDTTLDRLVSLRFMRVDDVDDESAALLQGSLKASMPEELLHSLFDYADGMWEDMGMGDSPTAIERAPRRTSDELTALADRFDEAPGRDGTHQRPTTHDTMPTQPTQLAPMVWPRSTHDGFQLTVYLAAIEESARALLASRVVEECGGPTPVRRSFRTRSQRTVSPSACTHQMEGVLTGGDRRGTAYSPATAALHTRADCHGHLPTHVRPAPPRAAAEGCLRRPHRLRENRVVCGPWQRVSGGAGECATAAARRGG
jgi:hypothetical protein